MTTEKKEKWYKNVVVSLLITIIVTGAGFAFKVYDVVENRAFDDTNQKSKVIELIEKEAPVGESDKREIMMHLHDEDYHMNFQEKATIIRIEENQKRIGQDLQEIKNLLKK